ncbi:MAG: ARMT1-like domain-containing protein [Blautia sp.]|uniref:damage-control phosphatase ARMT1 family protein n=1 Tax=Blautia sp. TaxID=1955243 RepID=UPI002E77ECC6|nr:ARMT1-like domain-containing protein [Blautia sp.]MED9883594.1 ARMT1-like domain-containing protein [Blautia sp.]
MKLNPFCMCCALNKQEQKIRHYPDMEKKTEYMKKVMALIANTEENDCAPSLSVDIQKLYSSFWNCPMEDFTKIKKEFNQLMLNMEASIEDKIRKANDPLEKALLYARIGNYIDFAALSNVDQSTVITLLDEKSSEALDEKEYENFLRDLSSARKLVYLTDNCGEVVLDKMAVKILKEQYPDLDITVIVRGYPVVNDATMEDAEEIGLTDLVKVIGNGSNVGGTWIPGINSESRELLYNADLIIAKGQGNFETLNDCGLNIYYLFLCKCDLFQRRFHAENLQGMFLNERRLVMEPV